MVIAKIGIDLVKIGLRSAGKYYNLESKAFSKLYTGFPRSKLVGRGVRHGLTAGSIAGTFINNNADETPGNGLSTKIPKQITSRQPYKTRRRQSTQSKRRYCFPSETYSGKRYSRSSFKN